MAAAPTLTLEDLVLGIDNTSDGCPPTASTTSSSIMAVATDPVARLMVPVVTVCVLVGVSVWCISKGVQYNEMFAVHPRYQYGLYAVNTAVAILAVGVLCYNQHRRET